MKTKFLATTSVFFALLGCFGTNASADLVIGQTVGVDFGSTASSDPFSTWNDIVTGGTASSGGLASGATTSVPDLVDITGATTGVSFGLTNNTAFNAWDIGNGTNGNGALIDHTSVFSDGLISNDAPGAGRNLSFNSDFFTLTFSGLNDSLLYDFSGGYARNNNSNFNGAWTANGQTISTNASYADFTGLSTDGSGNLTITLTGAGPGNAAHVIVSAVTVTATAVPEPTSAVLLGLCGLAAFNRRRR